MTYHNVATPDHLKYTADLARKMIVHVAIKDARWRRFPVHTFNSNGQKAERALYHGLKKKVEELQREAKKVKEDRQLKRQQEKIQLEARLKAEEIVANERLPQVIASTIDNPIEIGIADSIAKDASGKNSGAKRIYSKRISQAAN